MAVVDISVDSFPAARKSLAIYTPYFQVLIFSTLEPRNKCQTMET